MSHLHPRNLVLGRRRLLAQRRVGPHLLSQLGLQLACTRTISAAVGAAAAPPVAAAVAIGPALNRLQDDRADLLEATLGVRLEAGGRMEGDGGRSRWDHTPARGSACRRRL